MPKDGHGLLSSSYCRWRCLLWTGGEPGGNAVNNGGGGSDEGMALRGQGVPYTGPFSLFPVGDRRRLGGGESKSIDFGRV